MNRIFSCAYCCRTVFVYHSGGCNGCLRPLGKEYPYCRSFFMLLLVVSIEKLIHTTYTVTADNRLLLFFGRFSRGREILLKDITSVERTSSMRIGDLLLCVMYW